jgi:hypothetical protein
VPFPVICLLKTHPLTGGMRLPSVCETQYRDHRVPDFPEISGLIGALDCQPDSRILIASFNYFDGWTFSCDLQIHLVTNDLKNPSAISLPGCREPAARTYRSRPEWRETGMIPCSTP